MNTLPQTQNQIKITIQVDSGQCSDIICGLSLFARIHPGEVAKRCQRLSQYLWVQAFHDLGQGKAA